MNKMLFKKLFLSGLLGFTFFLPTVALAQNTGVTGYTPLAPIPELMDKTGGQVDINSFIPGAIKLAISIASALSVIFIIYGGVLYITTDSMGGKSNAKDTIENAIMGLLLAIGSYAILYTINPKLVVFTINLTELEGTGIDFEGAGSGPVVTGNGSAFDVQCLNDCVSLEISNLPRKDSNLCSNSICYLNTNLINKLKEVDDAMGNMGWQITEAFPPTVTHQDSCHKPGEKAGTCADIALTTSNSIETIYKFLKAIKDQGLKADYEVTSAARYTELQSSSLLYEFRNGGGIRIIQNAQATGEHVHVEL